MGFNGAETNCTCGIGHILGILLMNSYNTDKFLASNIIYSLSTLNGKIQDVFASGRVFDNLL